YGEYVSGPRVVNDATRAEMKSILADIQSGKFVKDWMLENRVNQTSFKAMRTKMAAHPIEEIGAKLRAMMPWIKQRALVDRSRNGPPQRGGLAALPPAVSLSQVSITFRLAAGGTYPAVDGVSLAVAAGEFVAIVGPTGCGKSTLLNVAAGLIAPSSGRIDVFGAPLAGLNRQAGYLLPADGPFPPH